MPSALKWYDLNSSFQKSVDHLIPLIVLSCLSIRKQMKPINCNIMISFRLIFNERRQTGKGANHTLFFGAGNGLAQLAKNRVGLAFPASFSLVHFFWRSKRNEHLQRWRRDCGAGTYADAAVLPGATDPVWRCHQAKKATVVALFIFIHASCMQACRRHS